MNNSIKICVRRKRVNLEESRVKKDYLSNAGMEQENMMVDY